ncbi:MAG: AtpZ/AtpI family protein [Saprospiraceae bacterium]
MKYSGMAFELLAIVLISVYLGSWIDDYFGFQKPYIMLLLIIVLFVGYMIRMFKDLNP